MTDDARREDPEALDPNNQPAPDNPIMLTRFGREIRFKRLYRKFVTQEAELVGYAEDEITDDREEYLRKYGAFIAKMRKAGWPEEKLERFIRERIPPGDHPDPLTEEDEEILDRVWAMPIRRPGELKKDE